MALLKKRPQLRLLAPPAVRPGESFVAEVIVRAQRPVPIDSLDVRFEGEERVTVGSGKHARTASKCWVALHAQLSKARRMVGEQRFKVRLHLPENVQPSYVGCQARVEYLVKIRASIPWWPDAHANFVIPVVLPPSELEAAPIVFSSNPDGPVAGEPHVEASLANTNLQAGGVLRGAVALSNVATSRYFGIQVRLRGRQVSKVRRSRTTSWCFDYTLNLPDREIHEGKPVPFSMQIPAVHPTTQGEHFALSWVLEVRARRRLARDLVVRAPVVVWPRDDAAGARGKKRLVPPTVGSPRVIAVWKRVAAEIGLSLEGDALVGNVGQVRMVVRREASGSEGNFLMGTLTFPSVHLGLDAGPIGGFARYVQLHERLEWPDEHHYFQGRDMEQVRAFATNWVPRGFPHEVVDASDEMLLVRQKGAGQTHKELHRFVRNVNLVAHGFAKALARVPAPSQFSQSSVAAWRHLSDELRGELELTRMAIQGHYDGRRASVCTHWSNRGPWQTEVSLEPLHPLNDSHALRWSSADGPLPQTRMPRGAGEALATLTRNALGCTLAPRKLGVSLPAPLTQADAALGSLRDLVNLELALQRRSAYR
jgi:hypothetical protein